MAPTKYGGKIMGELDTLCVPDVFATCNKIEDAGGGCLRIYNCVEKNGQLVPVGNAVVVPASCIVRMWESAQEFARRVMVNQIGQLPIH